MVKSDWSILPCDLWGMYLKARRDDLFLFLQMDRKLKLTPSIRSLLNFIITYFGDEPITREKFTQFIYEKKKQGLRSSSLNNYIKYIKHIGKFLKTDEFNDYSYFKETEEIVQDILTKDEVDRMANVHVDYSKLPFEVNFRFKCFIYFLFETGCRLSEIQYFKWRHLHEDFIVFPSDVTKTHKQREVPIQKGLFTLLSHLPHRSEYVFGDRYGKPMSQQYLSRALYIRAHSVGIKKRVNPHTFRHTFITLCIENGMPISMVASIVGHSNIETTHKYYVHLQMEQLREALYNSHPSFKRQVTLDMVKKKLKDSIGRLIDPDRFSVKTEDESGAFSVTVRSKP